MQTPLTINLKRYGDFYEAFDAEAREIARITGRRTHQLISPLDGWPTGTHNIGVPYHSIYQCVIDLEAAGYAVKVTPPLYHN